MTDDTAGMIVGQTPAGRRITDTAVHSCFSRSLLLLYNVSELAVLELSVVLTVWKEKSKTPTSALTCL